MVTLFKWIYLSELFSIVVLLFEKTITIINNIFLIIFKRFIHDKTREYMIFLFNFDESVRG